MAFIIKALGAGYTQATSTDLYTVPDPKSAMVTSVHVANGTANAATVNLSVVPSGGTQRLIAKPSYSLPANGAALLMQDAVTVGKGDIIRMGLIGTSPSVSYVVMGLERE